MGERTCFSVPQHTNCLGTPGSRFKKDKEKIPAPPSPQPVLTAPLDLGTMSAAAGTLKPAWSQVAASMFKLGNMGQVHPASLAAGACGQQARSETQPCNFQSFLSPFPEPFLDLTCPYRGMGIRLQAQFPQCLPEHHCKYHSTDFSWLLCCPQVPQERGSKGSSGHRRHPMLKFLFEGRSAQRCTLTPHLAPEQGTAKEAVSSLCSFSHKPVLEQKGTLVPDF